MYGAVEIVARPDLLSAPGRDTGVVLALAETLGGAARVTLTTGMPRTGSPLLVVAAEESAQFALQALLHGKRRGQPTAFHPLISDPTRRILGLAEQVLRTTKSLLDTATALADPTRLQMNGSDVRRWAQSPSPAAVGMIAGAIVASDAIIVRDRGALARVANAVKRLPRAVATLPWTLPAKTAPRSQETVVVAAPSMTAEEALPAVFAATRLARRVRLICRRDAGLAANIEVCIAAPNAPYAEWMADAAAV
ncbi:MAG: hypothetical protein KGM44_12795, partial [bacterium]|nr:hypothetical protein [bacterium]